MQISPEDIRWEGEEMVTSHHGAHNGQGRGVKKSLNRGGRIPNNGRVRGPLKSQSMKDSLPSQNGISKKVSDDIELLNTDSLVKEVCLMNASQFNQIFLFFIFFPDTYILWF